MIDKAPWFPFYNTGVSFQSTSQVCHYCLLCNVYSLVKRCHKVKLDKLKYTKSLGIFQVIKTHINYCKLLYFCVIGVVMKKEWVKLKTAVNMAAAMEVLTQSFTFKVFASFKLVILTSPGFCLQQKQQQSYLDLTIIRKWRYSHNPQVFFLKKSNKISWHLSPRSQDG